MFVIIWRFVAAPGKESEFEALYGAQGAWARLFARHPGYVGTELLRTAEGLYFTIDRWESQAARAQFMRDHADEYRALDRRCEELTAAEALIAELTPPE